VKLAQVVEANPQVGMINDANCEFKKQLFPLSTPICADNSHVCESSAQLCEV